MNLDNVKSDLREKSSDVRRDLSKRRMRNRGLAVLLGMIPTLLTVALVALRFVQVRNQVYKVLPKSRNFLEKNFSGERRRERAMGSRLHERTPYGEA